MRTSLARCGKEGEEAGKEAEKEEDKDGTEMKQKKNINADQYKSRGLDDRGR